jgi:hypothetical protein
MAQRQFTVREEVPLTYRREHADVLAKLKDS